MLIHVYIDILCIYIYIYGLLYREISTPNKVKYDSAV